MAQKEIGFKINIIGAEKTVNNINQLKEAIKATNKNFQNATKGTKVYDILGQKLGKLKGQLKEVNTQQTQQIKNFTDTKKAANTIDGMRAKVSRLNKEWKQTAIGTKEFKRLEKELGKTTEDLKKYEKAVGNTTRNVGNYEESMKNAIGQSGLMGGTLGRVGQAFNTTKATIIGMTAATKAQAAASGKASAAAKVLKFALISTGIGAIVIAVMSLVAAFKSSEEGQNKMAKIMGVIGALTGNLQDLLASLGEKIIWVFENPKKAIMDFANMIKDNIVNRFMGMLELIPNLGKAISLLFKGEFKEAGQVAVDAVAKATLGIENITEKVKTGVEKAGKAIKKFAKEQVKEGKAAAKVADMRAKADKVERDLLVKRSELEGKIAGLRLKARQEDEFSSAERKQALVDVLALEEGLMNKETEFLALRRDAQVLENTFSRTNKENKMLEAEAIAAVNNQETVRLNMARKIQRELNTINNEIEADNRKIASDKANRLKKEEDEQLEHLANITNLEMAQIENKYDLEILAAKGNKEAIAKIEEEKKQVILQKTRETLEGVLQELQGQLLIATSDANLGDLLLSEEDQTALELRIAELQGNLTGLDIQLQNLGSTEEGEGPQSLSDILGLSDEAVGKINDSLNMVMEGLTAVSNIVSLHSQNKILTLENEKEKAIEAAGEDADKKAAIEKDYNAKIEKEKKKAGEKSKKFALIFATIEMFKGIITAFNSGMSMGGIIPAGIFAALAGVMGALNIANIKKQKFAMGGFTGSGYGSADSTGQRPAGTVHEGEWVAPAWMVDKNYSTFSALDNIRQNGYAVGGFVTPSSARSVAGAATIGGGMDRFTAELSAQTEAINARMDRMQVVVSESEITDVQNRVSVIEEEASFG